MIFGHIRAYRIKCWLVWSEGKTNWLELCRKLQQERIRVVEQRKDHPNNTVMHGKSCTFQCRLLHSYALCMRLPRHLIFTCLTSGEGSKYTSKYAQVPKKIGWGFPVRDKALCIRTVALKSGSSSMTIEIPRSTTKAANAKVCISVNIYEYVCTMSECLSLCGQIRHVSLQKNAPTRTSCWRISASSFQPEAYCQQSNCTMQSTNYLHQWRQWLRVKRSNFSLTSRTVSSAFL